MTISDETWQRWIAVLEDILHEADVHREHKFGIHIDAAILAAHATLGTERGVPRHDEQPE
jgi:truncated hemoglobin YjbI